MTEVESPDVMLPFAPEPRPLAVFVTFAPAPMRMGTPGVPLPLVLI